MSEIGLRRTSLSRKETVEGRKIHLMGLSYQEFKQIAAELAGVDLSAYKSQQMDRRIHSLMSLWGVADYDEYLAVLRTNEARFKEFQKKLTINVSEFYRNPERFAELVKVVLPELYRSGRRLRLWSAGCSNGAEPYTLAILIRESGYPPEPASRPRTSIGKASAALMTGFTARTRSGTYPPISWPGISGSSTPALSWPKRSRGWSNSDSKTCCTIVTSGIMT